jgi:hypothetical protein
MAKKPAAPAAGGEQPSAHVAKSSAPAFVFIGDAKGDGPDEIAMYGYTFAKNGKAVAVDNPAAVKKFAGNGHFKAA